MAQSDALTLDRLLRPGAVRSRRSSDRRLAPWSLKRLNENELAVQHEDGTGIVLERGQEGSLEARLLRRLVEDLLEE